MEGKIQLACPLDGLPVTGFDREFTDAAWYTVAPEVTVTDGPELVAWTLAPCGHRLMARDWELCWTSDSQEFVRAGDVVAWMERAIESNERSDREQH